MLSTWMRWIPFYGKKKRHKRCRKVVIWTWTMCKALPLQKLKMAFSELCFSVQNPFYEWGNLCYELITLSLLFYYMDDGWNVLEIFLRFSSSLPPYPFFHFYLMPFLYFILQQFLMLILWIWKIWWMGLHFIKIPFFLSNKTKFI